MKVCDICDLTFDKGKGHAIEFHDATGIFCSLECIDEAMCDAEEFIIEIRGDISKIREYSAAHREVGDCRW